MRDVGLAEDLAQDALLIALETWPKTGVPDNPGAWLMTTAKRRAIDLLCRDKRLEQKHEELARLAPSPVVELNRAVAVAMAFGPAGRRREATARNSVADRRGRADEARSTPADGAALTR